MESNIFAEYFIRQLLVAATKLSL